MKDRPALFAFSPGVKCLAQRIYSGSWTWLSRTVYLLIRSTDQMAARVGLETAKLANLHCPALYSEMHAAMS